MEFTGEFYKGRIIIMKDGAGRGGVGRRILYGNTQQQIETKIEILCFDGDGGMLC